VIVMILVFTAIIVIYLGAVLDFAVACRLAGRGRQRRHRRNLLGGHHEFARWRGLDNFHHFRDDRL
jgi:hypothetical protein